MYLRMPNNYVLFFPKGISSFQERLAQIENLVLNYNHGQWLEWCNKAWFGKISVSGVEMNPAQKLLERCADYLLTGNFSKAEILTFDRMDKIRQKEIPVSCTSSSVAHLIYGEDSMDGERDSITNVSDNLNTDDIDKDIYNMNAKDFERRDNKDKTNRKTWKKSKSFKMNKFRSTEAINTYRIKPVMTTDKDGKRKPLKTLDGVIVLDAVPITIGGHKGTIDELHIAKWCTVDTENIFEFMGKNYRISDSVEQYTVDLDNDNKASMEKILCYYLPQSDKYLYFDENIEVLDEAFITNI